VHLQQPKTASGSEQELGLYETELLIPFEDTEGDRIFFARLDGQLNKVNRFYKEKEEEYFSEGQNINDQLVKLEEVKKALARKQELINRNGEDIADSSSYNMRGCCSLQYI
jgi:hypothetical protein